MSHSGFPKFETAIAILGFVLLLCSARYGALLLLGRPEQAIIEYSVRKYGASRGTSYRVHYVFQSHEKLSYKGTVTVRRDYPPAGTIRVHYLPFWPALNFAGGIGAMKFYGLLTAVPGLLMMVLGLRLLQMKRATAARRKSG
jgi:hypothetical protein